MSLLAVLAGAFYAGGGWYFSGQIYQQALDPALKRAEISSPAFPIQVLAVDAMSVTLRVPADPDQVMTPGVWGLEGARGGFGQISAIESRGGGTVTRLYRKIEGPALSAGEYVRLAHEAFPPDPAAALGLAYTRVTYDGPLGSYPAWFIDGASPDWAILVHGNSLRQADMLRVAGPIHNAGLPILVITYRNDPGAPQDPSRMMRYGLTEWQDLDAAARFAVAHGAQHLVLVGVSMGGGIVMSFLYRSSLASSVAAVILDSPMLDFGRAIDHGASQVRMLGLSLPQSLVTVAKVIAGWRYGVDWGHLNYLALDSSLVTPILLFQGTADAIVPRATSDQLAADRPDLVTYVLTSGAGHVDSWNLDPARYGRSVQVFVSRYAAPPRA